MAAVMDHLPDDAQVNEPPFITPRRGNTFYKCIGDYWKIGGVSYVLVYNFTSLSATRSPVFLLYKQ